MGEQNLILLVGDNEDFQNLYGMLAETVGFAVEPIYDGKEALQRLERGPIPTMLLLDSRLPHANGLEILQAARSKEQWSHVPIYLITADLRAAKNFNAFSPEGPHPDGVNEKGAESIRRLRELFAQYRESTKA